MTLLRELALERERARRDQARPLRRATLWRPRCEDWEGSLALQPRQGCGSGAEMIPQGGGRFRCPDCGVEEQRTSQRDAIRDLLAARPISALIGGANRAGKTEGVLQLAIAVASGMGDPDARAWAQRNGIDPATLPQQPCVAWISALTFNDSKRYHRTKLDKLLPEGSTRHNWRAENQAEVRLPGGGELVLKAAAQTREKYQGEAIHLVVLDEEHPEEIHEECLRATAESGGLVLTSATPLQGLTWAYEQFVATPRPRYLQRSIYGLDNPHVPSQHLIDRFASLEPHKRRARLYGEWATAKGLIWYAWSRAVHVVPDQPLAAHWRKYRTIDFGTHFAAMWGCLLPTGQLLIYRVLRTDGRLLSENAREILRLSEGETYEWTAADPADAGARRTLAAEHELPTIAATKTVEEGIDAVGERLHVGPDGPTLLVAASAAPALQAEIEAYRRGKGGEVVKSNDHLCDCLRYLCLGIRLQESWSVA